MTQRRYWSQMSVSDRLDAIEDARELIGNASVRHVSWSAIARTLNLANEEGIRRVLDPEWAQRRAALISSARYERKASNGRPLDPPKTAAPIARRPEYQPDTRTITARLFGDPLPGRSALDQRREAEAA